MSDAGREPLLVELFTSQGCSSCPPADELLSRIGAGTWPRASKQLGRPIIPLAFHVDYWNYLGWSDPFSSSRWSDRQRDYARQLSSGRVYTPQLVIHGRGDAVGSRVKEVGRALERVSASLAPAPAITVSARVDNGSIHVEAAVTRARGSTHGKGQLEVWLALFENGVETRVARGENAGRTLRNDYVVRALTRGFRLGAAEDRAAREVRIALARAWRIRQLGVVVFVQDPETLQIHGAVSLSSGAWSARR